MPRELRGTSRPDSRPPRHQLDAAPEHPPTVGSRIVQRARVVLDWYEDGNREHTACHGWAVVEPGWVHLWDDENDDENWQSWPAHTVVCIDWKDYG